jgi:carboxylesterase type B
MGATNSTQREVILNTPSRGSLRGIQQADRITGLPVLTRYTRIPYALPPIASRRWQRPFALATDFSFSNLQTGDY